MNINVSIERLVLDGLPISPSQGGLVGKAVETELARLLAEEGLSHLSAGAVPHLAAAPIQLARAGKPSALGHQIAQAIFGSLTPSTASRRDTRFPGASHR